MNEPMSDLFKECSAIMRSAALPVLKDRAIKGGFITTVCMDCNAFIEDKPGAGVSGLSHGLCQKCADVRIDEHLSAAEAQ